MAYIENVLRRSVTAKLDDGTTSSGAQKTVSVKIGNIDKTQTLNLSKLRGIMNALTPCFNKSLVSLQRSETTEIEDDGE